MTLQIAAAIRSHAARTPHRTALITGEEPISFRAFAAMCDKARHALLAAGVRKGERVVAQIAGHGAMLALVIACAEMGAVAVPASARLSTTRLADLCAEMHASACTTGLEDVALLSPSALAEPLPDDTTLLLMTSGSTGMPKAVPVHAAMAEQAVANALAIYAAGEDSLFLNYSPPSTIAGLLFAGLSLLSAGVPQVCAPFQPLDFAALVARHRPSHTILLPVMLNVLRGLDSWRGIDLSCFDAVVTGSAPVFDHHARETLRRGARRFVHTYGLTECAPPVLRRDAMDEAAEELVALARFTEGWQHRFGRDGELQLRGTAMMRGYLGAPPGQGFDDGWFRTGDVFAEVPGGLQFVGRLDARLKINAWSVSPELTEAVVLEVPGVSAVAAVRDVGRSGAESLVAIVSGPNIDPPAILAHCRARLDPHQIPRRIVTIAQVPLNLMGKVDRAGAARLMQSRG